MRAARRAGGALVGLLLLIGLMAAWPVRAQEITTSQPSGAPLRYGTQVVAYVGATISAGITRPTVTVSGVQVGDFVWVLPDDVAGITVGIVIANMALVTAPNTVQLTVSNPAIIGVSLGTVNLRFRWIGW